MLRAIILIGGPQKGTRFRPLSLDIPKPLFPVGGMPLIQHHIEACAAVKNLNEIFLIGYYPSAQIQPFIDEAQLLYNVKIKYLLEFTALGTAGGLYHFRDLIRIGNPDAIFVMNGDVCGNFQLEQLLEFHKSKGSNTLVTIMGTETTKQQSLNYGCMATNKNTDEVTHYVEKPSSYVSTLINCGIYVFSLEIFSKIGEIFQAKQQEQYKNGNGNGTKETGHIQLEQEVLSPLAGTGHLFAMQVTTWWSQLKTAGTTIYANKHYLELYNSKPDHHLKSYISHSNNKNIFPHVYIHPSASIDPTAVIGPNVSIGPDCNIGPGVRIRESIILAKATIEDHSLVLYSIIGRNTRIGKWARVEGTPSDLDPNKPFAKMENPPLFNKEGRLNPSITMLGCDVIVSAEIVLLNSIVLPNKELMRSFKNEIIL